MRDAASNLNLVEAIQQVEPNWKPLGESGSEVTLEGHIQVSADNENEAIMPENENAAAAALPVNYDIEEKADGDKAAEQARHIKIEFARWCTFFNFICIPSLFLTYP